MPRVKQFDEKEVLEKAMELFWRQGYNGTSIGNLVEYLRVNRASLYGTFKDKKELFLRALAHYRNTNFSALQTQMKGVEELSMKEQIAYMFQSAIDYSIEDKARKGCFVVNTVVELAPHDELIKDTGIENQDTFVNFFSLLLEAGKENGELDQDLNVKAIAEYFYTLYVGLKVNSKVKPDRKTLESVAEIAMKALD